MNNMLLAAAAVAAILFVSACARHEPAPVSTSTTPDTQEVHTY